MFKRIPPLGWFCSQPYLLLVAAALLMAPSQSALADNTVLAEDSSSNVASVQHPEIYPEIPNVLNYGFGVTNLGIGMINPDQPKISLATEVAENSPLTDEVDASPDVAQASLQSDPIDSPHPVPWNWVLNAHAEVTANGGSGVRYYRTRSVVSPDGEYAAYSRIQLDAEPELHRSRVSSVMFLENLKTGELQKLNASSPVVENSLAESKPTDTAGSIAILMPVSWSATGSRLLARQLEGLFSTSDASDYALIWDRETNTISTISPQESEYSTAVLLGWSQSNPGQVLFRAGNLGDEQWPQWAVDMKGQTIAASNDQPVLVGKLVKFLWAGPQAHW
jgi:hypothetical protein